MDRDNTVLVFARAEVAARHPAALNLPYGRAAPDRRAPVETSALEIRVRGRVQGVGFRPMVWRHARDLGLTGFVLNDAEGVLIRVGGDGASLRSFVERIRTEPPRLGSINELIVSPFEGALPASFEIADSQEGRANTEVAPDAALCADCARDIFDPLSRRFRYPFTTCTNCGPRLSIVARMPYDRASTSMAAFDLCPECAAEYENPADRRFHAEATACHTCGPKARLIRFDGVAFGFDQSAMRDDVDAALDLILGGEIVAIKGLGGYHLACDATRADVVDRLRALKRRDRKPFALMARDLEIIRRYCIVTPEEEAALTSPAGPIVLLRADGSERVPAGVAPGLATLGFMLPTTPLHALLLRRTKRPVIMTSGNISDEPQVISDAAARERLGSITPFALVHDRDIVNRVDDSVVRFAGGSVRVLRRARGYAPSPVRLPHGFEAAPEIVAIGGDLKSAFCLVKAGAAVLSQHIGDLDDARTNADYVRTLSLYREMFAATPAVLVSDLHPGYRSTAFAEKLARAEGLQMLQVQHHHAHVASCLAENGRPLTGAPVLGIALDGLGYGADGEIWGGEFLLAGYRDFQRMATFKPVAMLGGDQAAREPWRNLYAHLMAGMGWTHFATNFAELDLRRALSEKPRKILDAMLRDGVNSPKASSCGRLFDATAAVMGLCFERQAYEGEAAQRLEASVDEDCLRNEDAALDYPFAISWLPDADLPYVEPLGVWNGILGDLIRRAPVGMMSARFHRGLARVIAAMALKLAERDGEGGPRFDTVALSGGCFNNRILLEQVVQRLERHDFKVLTHQRVPAGDEGLALGQAAIAAAKLLEQEKDLDIGGLAKCVSASPAASSRSTTPTNISPPSM